MDSTRIVKFLPRLQDVFLTALLVAVILLGDRMINLDGDLPRHLTAGKYILENLKVPTSELFIYPYEGRPYVSHEWLTQVIFYIVYRYMGLPGLVLLSASLLALTFFIPYSYLSQRLSLRLPVLLLIAWGALVTSINWAIRPHLFTMFFLSIWLVWADRLQRGEKISIWRFPALMLAWSNVHGVFIAGILVLLALAVGWIIDRLFDPGSAEGASGRNIWTALGFSTLASMLNPGGAGSWFSILGFVNNPYLMSRMLEANPPNFQAPEMRIFLSLLAFSIFLLAFKREKFSAGQGLLIAGFSALGLMAFRNVHLYGVVAPFVLAQALIELRGARVIHTLENNLSSIESRIRGGMFPLIPLAFLGIWFVFSPHTSDLYKFDPAKFPVQAVEWLENHPRNDAMFNDLNWGGYIELHLWPRQKAFVDSVADVTGEITREYETVITLADGWEAIFEKYKITLAIIPSDSPLAERLTHEKHWEILHRDETAVVLRK